MIIASIVYIIRNVFLLFGMSSLIIILPKMFKLGVFGTIFLVCSILYMLVSIFVFIIKSDNTKYSILNNFLGILLDVYLCLIAYKYIEGGALDNIYYIVNFGVMMGAMLGISFNNFILIQYKKVI